MGITQNIKESIARRIIEKRKNKTPFDENSAERFILPPDCGNDVNNSYYFCGHGPSGESLLFRLGIRGGGLHEIWFAIKETGANIYVNRQQVFKASESPSTAGCIKPGLEWKLSFKGKLAKTSPEGSLYADIPENNVEVSFEGIFTASSEIFEFSRHLDSRPLARALAKEKWSRAFFKSITQNHQVHYEQQGFISGTITVGKDSREVKLPAVRDHSFGKRDWNYMDRHIWLMAILENGDALNVNMVRYPDIRELQAGYYIGSEKTTSVDSVTSMDEIECSGRVPSAFNYTVRLIDGRTFNVACKKELEYIFPFDNGAYTIFEGVGGFLMDGIKGRGILEFGFNSDKSRWTRQERKD